MNENEGEDSFDVSPYLFENRTDTIIRDHIIMHGGAGTFAIREGDWKFIADSSSGGTSRKYKELLGTYVSDQPGQLYKLATELSEDHELYSEDMDRAQRMREKLITYIDQGRSNAGVPQKNDDIKKPWSQVEWLKSTWQPE